MTTNQPTTGAAPIEEAEAARHAALFGDMNHHPDITKRQLATLIDGLLNRITEAEGRAGTVSLIDRRLPELRAALTVEGHAHEAAIEHGDEWMAEADRLQAALTAAHRQRNALLAALKAVERDCRTQQVGEGVESVTFTTISLSMVEFVRATISAAERGE